MQILLHHIISNLFVRRTLSSQPPSISSAPSLHRSLIVSSFTNYNSLLSHSWGVLHNFSSSFMAVNMLACETWTSHPLPKTTRDCLPRQYFLIWNYNTTVKITATARTLNVYWKYSVLATFQCESLLLLENNKYFNNNVGISLLVQPELRPRDKMHQMSQLVVMRVNQSTTVQWSPCCDCSETKPHFLSEQQLQLAPATLEVSSVCLDTLPHSFETNKQSKCDQIVDFQLQFKMFHNDLSFKNYIHFPLRTASSYHGLHQKTTAWKL